MTTTNRTVYICCPSSSKSLPQPSKMFIDLGKATKRGVKKCYKCGIYNGTRGMVCKNKRCDAVFKDSGKKKSNLDSVKLITSSFRQVFSVRVRDTGPDLRGFIQLSVLQPHVETDPNIFSEFALCFVDSCRRLFDDSILQCHENEFKRSSPLCVHIESALQSKNLATALEIKRDMLNILEIGNSIKEKLWSMANNEADPLVQRISKYVMAVKCQVTPEHPLGYLHFYLLTRKGKDVCDSYSCSCGEFLSFREKSSSVRPKCLHYYACICGLACHPKYFEEFQPFILSEMASAKKRSQAFSSMYINSSLSVPHFKHKGETCLKHNSCQTKKEEHFCSNVNTHKVKFKKIMPKTFPLYIEVLCDKKQNIIHKQFDKEMCWTFDNWLSSVTESINETMQLENCSIVNCLIFHIPKAFCELFINRIPDGVLDKAFDLSCETAFQVTNLHYVKQIFDTPEVKLLTFKTLIRNISYVGNETSPTTYAIHLDLGDNDKGNGSSFIIEWIPDVLSVTKLGQLKFQYRFIVKSR